MNTTAPTVCIDLSQVRSKDQPLENHFGNKTTRLVIGRDTPDDIYRLLEIDPNIFSIFIETTDNTNYTPSRYNTTHASRYRIGCGLNPVFEPITNVFLYMAENEKTGNHHQYYHDDSTRCVHISTPSATYRAEQLTFRDTTNLTHYDEYTATLTLTVSGARSCIYLSCRPEIAETAFRMSFGEQGITCMGVLLNVSVPDSFYQRYKSEPINFTLNALERLKDNIRLEANVLQLMRLLKHRTGMTGTDILIPSGNKKVLVEMLPFYTELMKQDEPILLAAFQTLVFESKRTINGVKVAKFFNEFFAPVRDIEAFKAKLHEIYSAYVKYESGQTYRHYQFDELFTKLPGYNELRKQALRSQSGRALNKMVTDIEAIQFDQAKYPILAELINDGSIPVSTFFRKEGDESYFLFNDNWSLFEDFLSKHKDVGIKLAQLASQRTTYEKSFMSYMYFVLHDLPEYLEKHTGKRWTCFPSIIESTQELEPGTARPGETIKKRSALTPIVDNEACTVVVPYACLKVPGMQTTYTYSLNYSLIRRGLSIDGGVVTNDIEEKLNGRDDYGLMFYTLTGSATGRGYPTFLIIFERLDKGETRVHFHRTHPLRSKDGDKNPINNWIRTCYNWMVGNVNMAGIKVQQGDLVFVSVDSLPEGEQTTVNSYDSHTFSKPILFVPYTKKDSQNILGYFGIAEEIELNHLEHRQRVIPAGYYELRQCRSWEANPKGIWTLRID